MNQMKTSFHSVGARLLMVMVLLGACGEVLAQSGSTNARGFVPGNSFAIGDFETINMSNGNLMLRFPLGSLPLGRNGLTTSVYLNYNSKLYDTERKLLRNENYQCQFISQDPDAYLSCPYYEMNSLVPSAEGGWTFSLGYQLKFEDRRSQYSGVPESERPRCLGPYGGVLPDYDLMTYVHKLYVIFPDGSQHQMIPNGYSDRNGDRYYNVRHDGVIENCGGGLTQTGQDVHFYTLDGTYVRMKVIYDGDWDPLNNAWALYFPDGTRFESATNRVFDKNGNYVQFGPYNGDNSVLASDQFGRTIRSGYDETTGEETITTDGVSGEDIVWRIKRKSIAVSKKYNPYDIYASGQSLPPNYDPVTTGVIWPVVEKITLPAQTGGMAYVLDYNAPTYTGGQFPSTESTGFGELSSIKLPSPQGVTPAEITYAYGMDSGAGGGEFRYTKEVLKNTITGKTLTYLREYDGQTSSTTEKWVYGIMDGAGSVTGPDGSTLSETSGYSETSPIWKAGLSLGSVGPDGTKVEKLWAQNCPQSTACSGSYPTNPYVDMEFTSIKNASGSYTLTSIKDFSYDKNGNITEVKEYDWVPYGDIPRSGINEGQFPTGLPSGVSTYLKRITKTAYYNDTPDATSTIYNDVNMYHSSSNGALLRLAKSTEIQDASQTPKSRSEMYYDEATLLTPPTVGDLTLTKSWDSTKGALQTTDQYGSRLYSDNFISTSAVYNQYGMPTETTDPKGVKTTITYGNVLGPNGNVTNLYPTQTEVASNYSDLKRTSTAVYDFYTGVLTSATDEDNDLTTVTEYDVFGRPTKVRSAFDTPLESWVQTIYQDTDRRVIVKADLETMGDAKKVSTQFYDQLGRVRLAKTLENAATQSATNETDGIKVQTRYAYDDPTHPATSNGAYTLTSNPYRATTSSAASGEPTMGWTVEFESKSGNLKTIESFAGSGLPSLWGSNVNSMGKSEETEDANATTTVDEGGKTRRTIVDSLGRLIRVDEPNLSGSLGTVSSPSQATEYSYDSLGNLLQIVQGGQTRTFTYSSLSRLLTANNPESGTFQFGYDSNGNLTSKTDARNIVTAFTYDALNRATARNYSDSTPDVTYTYDDSQVAFSKGKLTEVASSVSESLITSYDAQERITGSQQKTDGQTYSFSYTYNLGDDLLTQTYPSGKVVEFDYDSSGDLTQVAKSNGFVYANSFSYAPHGQVEKFRLGNGLWETTQFNSRRQITQIGLGHSATDTGFWKTAYEYGDWNGSTLDTARNNNSLARQTITIPTIGTATGFTAIQKYTYDSLDRLKSAAETIGGSETWKQTFRYDRFGNRNFDTGTTLLSNDSSVTKIVNPEILTTNNQFKLDQDSDSVNDYEYDPSGNLTKNAQGRTFAFNAENLQTTATGAGLSFVYSYDGNNKRVKSYDSVNGKTTIFVYDARGVLAAEYTINVTPATTAVISYTTDDALGSPRIVTNSFAEVKSRRDFLPFGEELYAGLASRNTSQKYSSSTDDTRKKFATYQRDLETGLDFAQSRYYSPMHGRFASSDEFKGGPDELFDFEEDASSNPTFYADLTNPQSLNKYQYGYNNPYKFTDEEGHCPICIPLVLGGGKVLVDIAVTSATGIFIGSAVGTVVGSSNATPAASLGDGSCPSCDRNLRAAQQRFERQAVMNQNAQTQTRPTNSAPRGNPSGTTKTPNPDGRKGGPRHQKVVKKIEKDVRSRGLKSQREHMIKTPGGEKSKRFVDVVGIKGKKVVEMHQAGRKNKNGTPVSRERKANDDIKKATGKDTKFHPIN